MTAAVRSYAFTNLRVCKPDGSAAVTFEMKAAQVQFDSSWSPYCQASITTGALTATQIAGMDPRTGVRVRFTLTETDTNGATYSKNYDLGLRSRVQSWATGELTLSCSSDEALLQDFGYLTTYDPTFLLMDQGGGTYYASELAYVVVQNLLGGISYDGPGSVVDILVAAADATISPGSNAWEYVSALAEAAGAWLWVDEQAGPHWTARSYTAVTTTFQLSDVDAVMDVTDTVSREDPAFGTSLVIAYTGNSPTLYLTSDGGVNPAKMLVVTRNRRRPSNGSATPSRQRAQLHGRSVRVSAAADVRARPNQSWKVSWLGQSVTGTVRSVAFDFPDGTMDLVVNI